MRTRDLVFAVLAILAIGFLLPGCVTSTTTLGRVPVVADREVGVPEVSVGKYSESVLDSYFGEIRKTVASVDALVAAMAEVNAALAELQGDLAGAPGRDVSVDEEVQPPSEE